MKAVSELAQMITTIDCNVLISFVLSKIQIRPGSASLYGTSLRTIEKNMFERWNHFLATGSKQLIQYLALGIDETNYQRQRDLIESVDHISSEIFAVELYLRQLNNMMRTHCGDYIRVIMLSSLLSQTNASMEFTK